MYLLKTIKSKSDMQGNICIPYKATQEEISVTEKVEVWASNFSDAGDDFCELRFFKSNEDKPFKTEKILGY